jgi:hypothetical protein
MNAKEELTKLLMESYDQGVKDGLQTRAAADLLAQPEQERNFCSRCGKRTKDLTHIHTCTPPQEGI